MKCKRCGACCLNQFVPIRQDSKIPITMRDGDQMRITDGKCAAFRGRLGGPSSCAIYEDRPEVCRVFAPGSWACCNVRAECYIGGQSDILLGPF